MTKDEEDAVIERQLDRISEVSGQISDLLRGADIKPTATTASALLVIAAWTMQTSSREKFLLLCETMWDVKPTGWPGSEEPS